MKLLLMLCAAWSAWGAGSVTSTLTSIPGPGGTATFVLTYSWTGDASTGSVPATASPALSANPFVQGYYMTAITVTPGSPSPTGGYAVTVKDANGYDWLAGQAAALSATAPASYVNTAAPPLSGSLTLAVTGNSVASAQGSVVVYFANTRTTSNSGWTDDGTTITAQTGRNVQVGGNLTIGTTVLTVGSRLTGFGDSIMFGSFGTPPWFSLVAAQKGLTVAACGTSGAGIATNCGTSGYRMPDAAPLVFATSPAYADQYVLGLGTNDEFYTAGTAAGIQAFQDGYLAEAAYLGSVAGQNLFLGTDTSNIAYTGSWAASPNYSIGKYSATTGDTAVATVAGTAVGIATDVINSNGGTFTAAIDGVSYGTYTSSSAWTVTSFTGLTYCPKLVVIAPLPNGTHVVTITVTSSTSAANKVVIDYITGFGGSNRQSGPWVYALGLTRATAAYYSGLGWTETSSNHVINAQILDAVNQLAAYGLNVSAVNVSPALNNMPDPTAGADLSSDGLHPNTSGHAKYAQAVLRQMNGVAYPADRQSSLSNSSGIFRADVADGWMRLFAPLVVNTAGNTNFRLLDTQQNTLRWTNPNADGLMQFYDGAHDYSVDMFHGGTSTIRLDSATGQIKLSRLLPGGAGNTHFSLIDTQQDTLRWTNPSGTGTMQFYDGVHSYVVQMFAGNTQNITLDSANGITSNKLNLTGLPISCSGQPANTVASVAGVLTLCP